MAEQGGASLLLIDDGAGRREALQRGLTVQGTLGILDTAAARGLTDLPRAVARLRRTNFRASEALYRYFLNADARRRSGEV